MGIQYAAFAKTASVTLSFALVLAYGPTGTAQTINDHLHYGRTAQSIHFESIVPIQLPREQRLERLDALFSALKTAADRREAFALAAEIWGIWNQSGSAAVDSLMREAHLLMRFDDLEGAMAALDQVVQTAPGFAEGWNRRATVLYMMRAYERSLADIVRVLELEPRHFGALSGRGLCELAMGRRREALTAFRLALSINPFLTEGLSLAPALERELEGDPT